MRFSGLIALGLVAFSTSVSALPATAPPATDNSATTTPATAKPATDNSATTTPATAKPATDTSGTAQTETDKSATAQPATTKSGTTELGIPEDKEFYILSGKAVRKDALSKDNNEQVVGYFNSLGTAIVDDKESADKESADKTRTAKRSPILGSIGKVAGKWTGLSKDEKPPLLPVVDPDAPKSKPDMVDILTDNRSVCCARACASVFSTAIACRNFYIGELTSGGLFSGGAAASFQGALLAFQQWRNEPPRAEVDRNFSQQGDDRSARKLAKAKANKKAKEMMQLAKSKGPEEQAKAKQEAAEIVKQSEMETEAEINLQKSERDKRKAEKAAKEKAEREEKEKAEKAEKAEKDKANAAPTLPKITTGPSLTDELKGTLTSDTTNVAPSASGALASNAAPSVSRSPSTYQPPTASNARK